MKEVGSKRYLACSGTKLLSLVAKSNDYTVVWAPDAPIKLLHKIGFTWAAEIYLQSDMPRLLTDWIDSGHTFVAHNASGFDAPAWERFFPLECQPKAWYDTMHVSRAAGLPGALDDIGRQLFNEGKDEIGQRALAMLYTAKVRSDGSVIYPKGTPPLWKAMLRYNVQDVLLLEKLFPLVHPFAEAELIPVHEQINARGIRFDKTFALLLSDLWAQNEIDAADRLYQITNGEINNSNMRSGPQVKRWLAKNGFNTDTLDRKYLQQMYDSPEDFFLDCDEGQIALIIEVLKLRQAATRAGQGKLLKGLELVDEDGRIRDLLVYFGAHTGRFSGRGLQPQNFARPPKGLDVEKLSVRPTMENVRSEAKRCKVATDDVISALTRGVFIAPKEKTLAILDFSSVEARCVAWMAGQNDLTESFKNNKDVYCEMASKLFGEVITKENKEERQLGKIIVLGCGYGMSEPKFALTCKQQGCDLAAIGITAEECVEAYRSAYPHIAGFMRGKFRQGGLWQRIYQAVRNVVTGDYPSASVGKCDIYASTDGLIIKLPSGRMLCYRNPRIEFLVPPYAAAMGLPLEPKATVVYDAPKYPGAQLYGGKIVENVSQAICRDLLTEAMVRIDSAYPIVMHVHDEIVCEIDEDHADYHLHYLINAMSYVPEWARGFPIGVEGFTCRRYSKVSFSDSLSLAR